MISRSVRSAPVLCARGCRFGVQPRSAIRVRGSRTQCNKASSSSGGILNFPKQHPFAFQVGIATVKTGAADLMAQMVVEKKKFEEVNWQRNLLFVLFGGAYLGVFQGLLMVNMYGKWFPTMYKFGAMPFSQKIKYTAGMIDAGKMVLFDLFIHLPLIYFPTFYVFKESVYNATLDPAKCLVDGLAKWQTNFMGDWVAVLKIWGPSDCIQFVLPIWMRMPFRHIVSFFWTAYVSFTRA